MSDPEYLAGPPRDIIARLELFDYFEKWLMALSQEGLNPVGTIASRLVRDMNPQPANNIHGLANVTRFLRSWVTENVYAGLVHF